MARDDSGDFGELLASHRPQRKLGRVEQHVRHIDDQPAGRIPSLENRVELEQELGAKLRLARLRLAPSLWRRAPDRPGRRFSALRSPVSDDPFRCWPLPALRRFPVSGDPLRFGGSQARLVLAFQTIRLGLGRGGLRIILPLHALGLVSCGDPACSASRVTRSVSDWPRQCARFACASRSAPTRRSVASCSSSIFLTVMIRASSAI